MQIDSNTASIVTIILAIGEFVQPMFFGAIFLFMFKFFPTRREIEIQEQNQQERHRENQSKFQSIERSITMLLSEHKDKN